MSPSPPAGAAGPPRRRPAVLALSGLVLLALLLLAAAAAWLPLRSHALLARGLEDSRPRVEAAFLPEVPEGLRTEVLAEIEAQAGWLRGLEPLELEPEEARTAALAGESLVRLLEDGGLDASEARFFVEQSRRLRSGSLAGGR